VLTIRERSKDELVVEIGRCFELQRSRDYDGFLGPLVSTRHPTITLDLARLDSINTLTLEKILWLARRLLKADKNLRILVSSGQVAEALSELALGDWLSRIEEVEEALSR
jgi:anti-anti-sigma regulatory factor